MTHEAHHDTPPGEQLGESSGEQSGGPLSCRGGMGEAQAMLHGAQEGGIEHVAWGTAWGTGSMGHSMGHRAGGM